MFGELGDAKMSLASSIKSFEKRIRNYYNKDLSTPENRRRAMIYNLWFDHAILRIYWTNYFEIAPGVFRSNQPTNKRFETLKKNGIVSILNLRGESSEAHYLVEKESCEILGLKLFSAPLYAHSAPTREKIIQVIEIMRAIEKPFVIHCKSGADRAGFASAIYKLVFQEVSVREARKMLSLRYAHIKWSSTGILDYILDCFDSANKDTGIVFEEWARTQYDQYAIQEEYNQSRRRSER